MAKIDVVWPNNWSGAPASAEVYANDNPKNQIYFADEISYVSGSMTAAAVVGGAAGTLIGGKNNENYSGSIYLNVTGGNLKEIYGGGQNSSVSGDIYLYLAAGSVKNVYGGAKNSGSVGAIHIQVNAGTQITGKLSLGGSGTGTKAKSADLTVSGENAFAGFTGTLDGAYRNIEGKKAYGTLTFSEATSVFSGKMMNFGKILLVKSNVILSQFHKTTNYKNISSYSVDADSTLTVQADKKYTASANFSGAGTLVFSGNSIHSIKASSTNFEGNAQISAGTTLRLLNSFFSTSTNKATITVADGGILQSGSTSSIDLKTKLVGGSGSVVGAAEGSTLTVSGDISGFSGTFTAFDGGTFVLKSTVEAEKNPSLNLNFSGKKQGTIKLSSSPDKTVNLSVSGYNGKLYLNGNSFNIKTNTAQKLTVYGGGTGTVLDFDPNSNTMINTFISGTDSQSMDMSSYKTVVKNGAVNTIYGGGESMQVAWGGAVSSTLVLEGGVFNSVFGGNKGFSGTASAGDVVLEVKGGTINKEVYGGGYVFDNGMSASASSVTMTFSGGTVAGNIYGGGKVHPAYTTYYKDYATGTIQQSNSVASTSVSGNVQITLEGGASALANVYLAGTAGKGKSYIDGSDNFIKLSKVYYEHEETIEKEDETTETILVPTSALAGFQGLLKGSYQNSKGSVQKGKLYFSDYQVEFLGRVDGFSELIVTDRSNMVLNWTDAGKRYKNVDLFRIAAESTLSLTASKTVKANLNLADAGTVVLASAQIYEFTGNLSKFHGTMRVSDHAVMRVNHKNSILTNNDPKRIATVDLGTGSKLQFTVSGVFGATLTGNTSSVVSVENKSGLRLSFNGNLIGYDGTIRLINSKNSSVEIATEQWDSLSFHVEGPKNQYGTVIISAGSGTVMTSGVRGQYFFSGCEVNVVCVSGTDSILYAGGNGGKTESTFLTISSSASGAKYARVFAGGLKSEVTGDASVTLLSGSVDEIYGGGDGKNSMVNGTSHVNVLGGTVGNIYGGGRLSGSGKNSVSNVVITISNAQVSGNIYAGGYAEKGASITVGNAEIIFASGSSFSGHVYGVGYASDKKSSSTVTGDSKITFLDYAGAFSGMIHQFDTFSVKGNTVLSFTQAQTDAGTIRNFIFDVSGRADGLGAMLTLSVGDQFSLVGADRIQLTIDRGTLNSSDPGSQRGYLLSDGAIYDLSKSFVVVGLNGTKEYTLKIGDRFLLNDEVYQLVLSGNRLELQYVIGNANQESLQWSRSFILRAAPLTALAYKVGTEINFANYGYIDADGDSSLKVKITGTYETISVGAEGVKGDLWVNVTGTGNTLTIAPENANVSDLNLRISNAWNTIYAGGDSSLSGNAWISLEENGVVKDLYTGNAVSGTSTVYYDGAYAEHLHGNSGTEVVFVRNYENLSSVIESAGSIRIGSRTVVMSGGMMVGCGTLSVDAGGELRVDVGSDAVYSLDLMSLTGAGALVLKNGTVNLTGDNGAFTGTVSVLGGCMNLNGGASSFANAVLKVNDAVLAYRLSGKSEYTVGNVISGNGTIHFENVSGTDSVTVTLSSNWKNFSGTISLGNGAHAVLSGKFGPATTVSGALSSQFEITGSSYDAEESTVLLNKGTTVYLNRHDELKIQENTGRIIYGGSGKYTAESHKIEVNQKSITAKESSQFFGGAGIGTTIGKGQTAASWSDAGGDKLAISLTVSDFAEHKMDALYGGSFGGTVDGDILVKIDSGEFKTVFAGGQDATVKTNTWVNVTDEKVKIDALYGGSANSGVVEKNTNIKISGGKIGTVYAGGSGDSTVKGDASIEISGNTEISGDILVNGVTGKGTVTLSSSSSNGEYLGKFSGRIDGGNGGERSLKFNNYKNTFAGTFVNFQTVTLTKSTVTLKGENMVMKADSVSIDKDSTFDLAGTGSSLVNNAEESVTVSGAGILQFSIDTTFGGVFKDFTGTIKAGLKTVKTTEIDDDGKETVKETEEKATLRLQSALGASVSLGGVGNLILDGTVADGGTKIKGVFSDSATLYTNNRNVIIKEGTFANIDMGSTETLTGDLSLKFQLSDSLTIKKDIYLGNTTGSSRVIFSGNGDKFTFNGKLYGNAESPSPRIVAFESYSGKFSGNIESISHLEVSGDSRVSFYAASKRSGATNFVFDVSSRSSNYASSAMISMQDNTLFDLAGAESCSIIVDSSKGGEGGSYTLVTNSESMRALIGKTFIVTDRASENKSFELNVDGSSVLWNQYNWNLKLNSAGTSLSLTWNRVADLPVSAMSSSFLTDELSRGLRITDTPVSLAESLR